MALDMKKIRARFKQMVDERQVFEYRYQDLADYILPDSGDFASRKRDPADVDRYRRVYDAQALDAVDVLSAGLLGGLTSPAKPWFRLTVPKKELEDQADVKRWLSDTTAVLQKIFLKSNLYQALEQMYKELAVFGTACAFIKRSDETVINISTVPTGAFWITEDDEGHGNRMYRRVPMTVEQMVDTFGLERCSNTVKKRYENNELFKVIDVIHAIEEREDYNNKANDKLKYKYRSVYFEEKVGNGEKVKYLLEEGFRKFPVMTPRWSVLPGYTYGSSPGFKALRQVKGLQVKALRLSQAIDKQSNPPIILPASMENHEIDLAPGGISFYPDGGNPAQAVPASVATVNIQHLAADIQDTRTAIDKYFYKDLFTMINSTARTNRTAYEASLVDQERLSMLGPVVQRLSAEIMRPVIEMTLDYAMAIGALPPLPTALMPSEENVGEVGIDVAFESILVQALRASGITATDRYVAKIVNLSQVKPDVLDNINFDYYARSGADMEGVDPRLVNSTDEVEAIRQGRQEAQQQQAQMAQQQQAVETAVGLSKINPQVTEQAGIEALQGY